MNHLTYSIIDIPPTDSLDDPAWSWAYRGMERVSRHALTARLGNDDLALDAKDFMVDHQPRPSALTSLAIAVSDPSPREESVLGWAAASLPMDANRDKAHIDVEVLPEIQDGDVADALLAQAEQFCWAHDRTALGFEVGFGPWDGTGASLSAPDGGFVPADAQGVMFAVRNGYSLTQSKRQSVLTLPMDAEILETLWHRVDLTNEMYRLHVWDEFVPDQWQRGFADVVQRFTSLAPYGSVTMEQEVWDEERVARADQSRHAMGRTQLRVAAEDTSTGQLVGYTGIFYRGQSPAVAEQGLTIVLPDHRGHHLGLWMKLTALGELHRVRPGIRRIYTWNAEENAPMLSINLAMGFVPSGGSGAMQKVGGAHAQ